MKQYLYVLINNKDNTYWAGISHSGKSECWATYFTEAKVFVRKILAEKELNSKNIDAKVYQILIEPKLI